MVTWQTPPAWSRGDPITENKLTAMSDDLSYLNGRPSDEYTADETSDYTTTSTSFVDVDAANFSLTITTNGGDVLVGFSGTINNNFGSGARVFLDVDVDGVREGGDDGIISVSGENAGHDNAGFVRLIEGLSAGSHTFKLQWKGDGSGTVTLYAGAGTAEGDTHPQFFVKEV